MSTNNNSKNHLSDSDAKQCLEELFESSEHCLWRIDEFGHFLEITPKIATLLGYSLAEILSRYFIDFIIEKERAGFLELFNRHQSFANYPISFLHKENKAINFKFSAQPLFDNNEFKGFYGIGINITEYKQTEEQLRQSENNLAEAQRIAHLGSWELDLVTNELFWSDEIYRILGKPPQSLKANYDDFVKVIHPDDLEMVTGEINAAMVHKTYDVQHRVIQESGRIGILHERGEVIFDDAGNPIRMVGTTQNITELKEAEQKIVQLQNYDFLTDLPNRSMFIKQTEHQLIVARRNKQGSSLLCIGLDRFKLVNESMGHEAGNDLLKSVADRLNHYSSESEIIARIGGDEFALLKLDISHEDIAALCAQKIINHFALPFKINQQEIVISISIGIAMCSIDERCSNELLKDAQTAMHRAKLSGGNTYQFYSWEMTDKVKERLSLESHLRRALEQQEFMLYYQPKVSTKTGKIAGAEALIRWQHPEKGLVPPNKFVSVLEDTGLIVPVGEWSLQEICRQYKTWKQMGFGDLSLALNLSVKQFVDNELCAKVQRTLEKFDDNKDFLELEVTESLLMGDLQNATQTLKNLHALGIRLSIDDFGTGYSSLAYLKLLPVDTLKIDRSFVIGLPVDPQDSAIAEVVIMLAKALNLKIVAEGVENKQQLDFLVDKGCDYIQGYYYSKPLPSNEFTELLKQEKLSSSIS